MREAVDVADFICSQIMIGLLLRADPGSAEDYARLAWSLTDAVMAERAKRGRAQAHETAPDPGRTVRNG